MHLIQFFSYYEGSTEKSFEIFPGHNGVATISEAFILNLIISVILTNE